MASIPACSRALTYRARSRQPGLCCCSCGRNGEWDGRCSSTPSAFRWPRCTDGITMPWTPWQAWGSAWWRWQWEYGSGGDLLVRLFARLAALLDGLEAFFAALG